MTRWRFQRGEDIAVPLLARGASPADIAGAVVTAKLKVAIGGQAAPPAAAPIVAEFAVEARDDLTGAGDGAGWLLSIAAATSATLPPGSYATNATITIAGSTIKSDVLIIRIEAST